ncbi:MAG: PAS domain-containing protein [Candidatus Harrisonbacteria bacterium]|nr:PAS domain-containing protein [Candidatus Harrisonbacteria bacterium]
MKLIYKIILLLIVISLVPVIGISYLGEQAGESAIKQDTEHHLQNDSKTVMAMIETIMYNNYHDLLRLKESLVLKDESSSLEDIKNILLAYQNKAGYASLSFFNMDRVRLVDTKDKDVGKQHELTPYWEDALAGKISAGRDIRIAEDLNIPIIYFAAPVLNTRGKPWGVLVMRYIAEDIQALLDKVIIEEGTHALLIDKNRNVIFSTDEYFKDKILKEKAPDIPSVNMVLEGKSGFIEEFYSPHKEVVFSGFANGTGFRDFPGNNWGIIISGDKNVLLAPILNLRNRVMIFTILDLLIVGIISYFLGRRINNQIKDWYSAAVRIQKGEYSITLQVSSSDERGKFTESFNLMSQKLKEAYDNLEQMVLKRTGELLRSEEKYRNLIETVPICIKIVNSEGRVIFLNKYGRDEHFIKEGADILQWDWIKTIESGFREAVQKMYKNALRGERGIIEFAHTPEGSMHGWCLSIFSPIKDGAGRVKVVMIYSSDATEKAHADKRVKELNDLRNKFIQLMSHQLRTPLNSMRWSIETLLAGDIGKLKDEQRNFLKIPYEANIEVLKRLDDILTVMDVEEGRITFKKEEISLDSIWKSVMGEFKNRINLKELEFQYIDPQKELPPVNCDGEKMRKALEQLLDNAVTYTPNKGKITVKMQAGDSEIRFEIIDTGIGIPTAEQPRIFSRFFRATNAYTMKTDASGIGLSLAKYFIEQHDGKIGFESEEGKGSTFWFQMPLS